MPVTADSLLTPVELCELLRISRPTLAAWIANGTLPPPIRLGTKKIYWRREDIDKLLAGRTGRGQD
jgi:excisionase family DNA binding protein